eukprot:Gregarina_sp_Poly_1__604@NODE_1142_length_4960_cov_250_301451_g788_i0_p2_GENE_NODE_1142_length_4960_cov_250_301451_g788_i0NODE_1142_length_4960_cov_250_301451_g788_i0_p2_ORF_typecomplete_len563_score68_49UDPGT/PF00201_18/4_2e33Glyco_tran_28_C/PF04101_16/0_036_NODE_1142_length_4960_cov_250_301451_g788_i032724870
MLGHVMICNALGVGHYQPVKAFVQLLSTCNVRVNISFFSVIRKKEESKCTPLPKISCVECHRVLLVGNDVHPITMQAMITRKKALKLELAKFVKEVRSRRKWGPISVVLHDPFALFAREWAIDLKIACVLFNPSNAFVWSLFSTEDFIERVVRGDDDITLDASLKNIKGQLVWNLIRQEQDIPIQDQEPVMKEFKDMKDMVNHACSIVGNDVRQLYPWALDKLELSINKTFTQTPSGFLRFDYSNFRYYCVSPLCLVESSPYDEDGCEIGYIDNCVSLKYWLDQKENRSVIYVALGTLYAMKREVIRALFDSLRHCPFDFVWSYREMHSPPALTPALLASLSPDKGVMLPWVKQKHLLMHPAIRIFISHCGWNSTLENLCFGGVPTLCVPLGSEQVMNTIMVCDVLRTGRIGMVENPEWKSYDWAINQPPSPITPLTLFQFASKVPLKYLLPHRACDFSKLIRETADVYYSELLLQAKEMQTRVLKAGAFQGAMIDTASRFAEFVNGLVKAESREELTTEEDPISRVLLFGS